MWKNAYLDIQDTNFEFPKSTMIGNTKINRTGKEYSVCNNAVNNILWQAPKRNMEVKFLKEFNEARDDNGKL